MLSCREREPLKNFTQRVGTSHTYKDRVEGGDLRGEVSIGRLVGSRTRERRV